MPILKNANADALSEYSGDQAETYAGLKLAGLRDAPVHLAVYCDEASELGYGLGRKTMPEMLAYSVVGAVTTLWLAARAHGIGLGWVSILDPERASRCHLGCPRRLVARRVSMFGLPGRGTHRPRARARTVGKSVSISATSS